jgi:KipI family sensor histidine kinase inhibitor
MTGVERTGAFRLPAIERLGEDAVLLRFGDAIDQAINARVHALARQIGARRPDWLVDIVPAYATLALFLDGTAGPLDRQAQAIHWLRGQSFDDGSSGAGREIAIAVQYGGDAGPDLDAAAAHAGLSPQAFVARHAAGRYSVAMLGFAPGFPYLLGLDPALAVPRLPTPRTRVEAGSIGIGGDQTGIYPAAGPGGWRIIGRTSQRLFDPARDPPALLAPGDRVRFVAMDGAP